MSANHQASDEVRGRRTRARWYVHLGLLALLAAALVTLAYLSVSISIHAVVGLVFVVLVTVHLFQRRRTVKRLMTQLAHAGSNIEREAGLAISDVVLAFVFLNVLLSGVVDWIRECRSSSRSGHLSTLGTRFLASS